MTGHLLLIDASGFAHRSFHASNPTYRESDGLPTYAVLGFLNLTWRLLGAASADPPTHAAAVFDAGGKTWRHRAFPAYKANRVRPGRFEELQAQFPHMHEAARVLGIEAVSLKGWEGDDLLATLASRAVKDGMRVTLVSSDKDFCGLVVDDEIEIIEPVKMTRLRAADVQKKFGVTPTLVPDVQALAGDAIDGVPGLKGLGLKGAGGLVRRFGGLDAILKASAGREPMAPAVRAQLRKPEVQAQMRLYKRLVTLRRTAPIKTTLDSLKKRDVERDTLKAFLKGLEASERFASILEVEPKLLHSVEALPDEGDSLAWWRGELAAQGVPVFDRAKHSVPQIPQVGWYKRRLVIGGAWVATRIWREPEIGMDEKPTGRDVLRCETDGRSRDPWLQWDAVCRHPISQADYEFMTKNAAWVREHSPDEPEARPDRAVDWLKCPI